MIDAESKKSKAINEGKAGVVVSVQGDNAREVEEMREAMMRKMMEEGIDEDLLDSDYFCLIKKLRSGESNPGRPRDRREYLTTILLRNCEKSNFSPYESSV